MMGKSKPNSSKPSAEETKETKDFSNGESAQNSKSARSGGGRNNRNRGKDKPSKGSSTINVWSKVTKDNDYTWYSRSKEALEEAAKFSSLASLGKNVIMGETARITPGIMVFDTLYGPGVSKDLGSGVNYAAKDLAVYISTHLNKTAPYDFQDTVIMFEAYMEMVGLYYEAVRAWRVAQKFDIYNDYLPEAIVSALGYDWNDLRDNVANASGKLWEMYHFFNSLPMPGDIPIIKKRIFFSKHLFTDGNILKTQYYAFRTDGYRTLDELGPTGSACRWHPFTPASGKNTIGEIFTIFNQMYNLLRGSDDFVRIMADLKNAFSDNLFTVDAPDQMGDLVLVEPHHVMTQIMNADVVGGAVVEADITQNPSINNGAILYSPLLSTDLGVGASASLKPYKAAPFFPGNQHICNLIVDQATPEDFVEASRLMIAGEIEVTGTDVNLRVTEGGDMILVASHIYYINNAGNIVQVTGGSVVSGTPVAWKWMALVDTFDYHPTVHHAVRLANSDAIEDYDYINELDNAFLVPDSILENVNRVCMKSLWGSPM